MTAHDVELKIAGGHRPPLQFTSISSSRRGHCPYVRDDRVNLGGLKKVLKGRHVRRPVKDVLAHDGVVTAARSLIQQRTEGLRIARGWQMADSTRLRQNLSAKPLLLVETIARLLAQRVLHASDQQE